MDPAAKRRGGCHRQRAPRRRKWIFAAVVAITAVFLVILLDAALDGDLLPTATARPGDPAPPAPSPGNLSVAWGISAEGGETLASQPAVATAGPKRALSAGWISSPRSIVSATGVTVSADGSSASAKIDAIDIVTSDEATTTTTRFGPIEVACRGATATTHHQNLGALPANVTVGYPQPQAFHATGAVITVLDAAKRRVLTVTVADVTCRSSGVDTRPSTATPDRTGRIGSRVDLPDRSSRCTGQR